MAIGSGNESSPDRPQDGSTSSSVPTSGGVAEYFPSNRTVTDGQRRELRSHYGWIRTYFKTRPSRYAPAQRWLNQARIGTTYDVYLARTVWYAVVATLVGVVAGVGLAWVLNAVGILPTLRSPVQFGGSLGAFLTTYRLWFAGGAIALGSALTLGLGTWTVRYYYPRYLVSERARRIDLLLPHGITYMYALSYGGMNMLEVVTSIAEAEDTYSEVANEFEMVVRDMEVFGTDTFTAIRNARNVTPSETMERFLDDLLSTLDAGGDPTTFLEEQSDKYMREAKDRQEYFLETLSLLSELFVFGFIAAPLFVIVTLMVISFIGGETLLQMAVLIYVGMPLGMVGFLVLIDVLSAPYVQPDAVLSVEEVEPSVPEGLRQDERYGDYRRTKRYRRLGAFARSPFESIEESPTLSVVITAPIALAFVALVILQGLAEPSISAFTEASYPTTTLLVIAPVLIVVTPLALFYERKRTRQNRIAGRFPDTLNVLSSANAMGIRLTEALGLVARYSTGELAEEMRKLRNDVQWNHDVRRALLLLGNRLKVPHLSRTIKLIADGGRSSGDLSRILSIAAEDVRNRARLERERRQEMTTYVAIVVIGFLVYLLVIVLIDTSYLAPFAELAAEGDADATSRLPASFTSVPIETYRALFFHSVVIQGFGAGLLAGKLSDNEAMAGLKYSIALVVLSVIVFLFI